MTRKRRDVHKKQNEQPHDIPLTPLLTSSSGQENICGDLKSLFCKEIRQQVEVTLGPQRALRLYDQVLSSLNYLDIDELNAIHQSVVSAQIKVLTQYLINMQENDGNMFFSAPSLKATEIRRALAKVPLKKWGNVVLDSSSEALAVQVAMARPRFVFANNQTESFTDNNGAVIYERAAATYRALYWQFSERFKQERALLYN